MRVRQTAAPLLARRAALPELDPVAGRMNRLGGDAERPLVVVDYAHTPDALENVIQTIQEIRTPAQQLIVVCGCGGDRDRTKRPEMAQIAVKYADTAIFTSDNPRHESPGAILDEMAAGLDPGARFLRIVDRAEAIRTAAMLSRPGDILLIAGKGHETYQIIGDVKHHFDDKEEVGKAFGMRVWCWGREGSTAKAKAAGFEVAPSREAFFAESDVISIHLPLTPETRGVIGRYWAIANPHALGLGLNVFISISLKEQSKSALAAFESRIAEHDEVMECYLMTGDSDYLIRVVVADIQALEKFILEQLSPIPGIEKIRSSFTLKQVRYKTALPVRAA